MTEPATPVGVVESYGGDPGHVDVWIFDRASDELATLAELGPMSEEVRERAERLKDPDARRDLLARRAAVRRVLGHYLERDPESVRIVTLPGGKPTLVPEEADALRLSYSSAHSGDLFCLAVGVASSVGIDVEVERSVPHALAIAARWFSADESSYLRGAPESDFSGEFLRLWTAKEALAKRHSAGLRLMSGKGDDLDVRSEEARDHLVHFVPRHGYVGALASTEKISEVRLLREAPRLV